MAFIISPVKSDDYTGILINVLIGPWVVAVSTLLFVFLISAVFIFGYYSLGLIIVVISHWINPNTEIYLLDNKFLSFINNLVVKNLFKRILDFEKSGIGIMLSRIILPWVFYYIIYLIAPATFGILNYISE